MSHPIVVLFSGGQDSATSLAWARSLLGPDLLPVSFFYAQRHRVELNAAETVLRKWDLIDRWHLITVPQLADLGGAALTDPEVSVELEASGDSGNQFAHRHGLPSTFVPGRNLLFLTLAAAYGAKHGALDLVTGVCETDRAGYPDCRSEFIESAQQTISLALNEPWVIHAPLLTENKARTWKLADDLGVLDIIIEDTHTCYHGNREIRHEWGYGCGECPACLERARGYDEFRHSVPTA